MKSMFLIPLFLFLLFTAGCSSSPGTTPSGLAYVASYEKGTLYRTTNNSPHKVILVKGSWREMGRQYGHLLGSDLREFYKLAVTDTLIADGETYEHLLQVATTFFNTYPQKHKDFILGMADTSGLSVDQQIILNIVDPYLEIFGQDVKARLTACSGIGAWGDYTADKRLVFGRNYDYPETYKRYGKYLTVTILDADGEKNKTAAIHWAGTALTQNGMNDKGIFLELNTDMFTCAPASRDRTPVVSLLLSFLQNSSTMEEIDAAFNSNRSDFGCLIQVADKNAAYSYEWPPFGVRRRSETDYQGLLVAVNNFIRPLPAAWTPDIYPLPDGAVDPRRTNLLALGNQYKGTINVPVMKSILDVSYEAGGAKVAGTVYQLIAVPETRRLWMRGIGYSDWVEIDLTALFAL